MRLSLGPILHKDWLSIGSGILLQSQNQKKSPSDPVSFFKSIKEHEMLRLKLLQPKRYPVAVDTGVMPYYLEPGTVLLAQVSDLRISGSWIQLDCDCYEERDDRWYAINIVMDLRNIPATELRITARLQPIKNFGAPAPDMNMALLEYHRRMSAPDSSGSH